MAHPAHPAHPAQVIYPPFPGQSLQEWSPSLALCFPKLHKPLVYVADKYIWYRSSKLNGLGGWKGAWYYEDWGVGTGGVTGRLGKPTVLGVLGVPWLCASCTTELGVVGVSLCFLPM